MSDILPEKQPLNREKVLQIILEIDDCYKEDAKAFVDFLRQNDLDISYESLKAYVEYLNTPHDGKKYSASTFNKRISGAKNRIRYIFEKSPDALDITKKYQLDRLLKDIKLKKINSHAVSKDKILTYEEIGKLIEKLRENRFPGAEAISYMVEFLSLTGVRISEMLNILISNIKRTNGHCEIRIEGKGKKERTVLISKELLKRIKSFFKGQTYLFEHSGKTYNPKYVTNQIRMGGLVVLDKDISAHTLRHSWATAKLKDGKSLKAVSKYLGHSSTATTSDLYNHDELTFDDIKDDFK